MERNELQWTELEGWLIPEIMIVLGVALALVLGLVVACVVSARVLHVPRRPDELLDVETEDGHLLGLSRYEPRGETRQTEPVILCHGLAVNRYNFDLDDEVSLALHLARDGFEVYVLELRGRGRSRRRRDKTRPYWVPLHQFDDYVERDVPAVLEAVCARSGVEKAHWVGHSMGGGLLYAHLARFPDACIRSAVAIAAPVLFRELPWYLVFPFRLIHAFPRLAPPLLFAPFAPGAAPLVALWRWFPATLVLNTRHTPWRRWRTALANLVTNIAPGELRHFARMMVTRRCTNSDDSFDYGARLGEIHTPILALAGSDDRLGTAAGVRATHEALGSADKAYQEFGLAHGQGFDFGHVDLVIGREAPTVVFPAVADWLRAHDPSARSVEAASE